MCVCTEFLICNFLALVSGNLLAKKPAPYLPRTVPFVSCVPWKRWVFVSHTESGGKTRGMLKNVRVEQM